MSIHPRHDELHDFWHEHQEPVNRNRLDVLLIVAAFFIMLAFVLWLIWDAVQASDELPKACAGMTNAWDCVALLQE
ncbi:hypothetical protein [Paracoccus sulfuroxidans]|uniref:Uncharacterized protein n=1 Tax=Paracoccus sulfuroxidans TaxID=384678 RepID=A0A562NL21_9RHOB|nr:hypothetical protein [Paracoccus sulfuroxidans]TWI32770.1 hypothetical protein IQ24_02645 [Paracoccus sulfuroxidans]